MARFGVFMHAPRQKSYQTGRALAWGPLVCAAVEVPRRNLGDPPAQIRRVFDLWAFDRRVPADRAASRVLVHVGACLEWVGPGEANAALVDEWEARLGGNGDASYRTDHEINGFRVIDTAHDDGGGLHAVVDGWREAVATGAVDHLSGDGRTVGELPPII
jgi:hypothetical protein